ncbi:MAG: GNAT family N-acetyltransferase [Myxococcota bacterium]|nr:GNAT family N-acetyltransferase [Myxococcota bacterium]
MSAEVIIQQVTQGDIVGLRAHVLSRGNHRVRGYSGDHGSRARHWAALMNDAIVGCVSVLNIRGWALRGMAVRPAYQRRGIGAALLKSVYASVDAPMWCNARIEVVDFYTGHGWQTMGPVFTMANGFQHQRMIWSPPLSADVSTL